MSKYILLFSAVIAIIYFNSCKGPQGPAGVNGNDGLTDPKIKPKIIYTFPAANSEGPYEDDASRIQFRFNKIMDRVSVKRAITLSSSVGGIYTDSNYISASSGDIFFISPRDSNDNFSFRYRVGQTYTVTISTLAKDVNGNYLSSPFSMTFKPEPNFRVTSISPSNGSTPSSLNSPIYIYFDSPVDTSIFSSIHIFPSIVGGSWKIVNGYPYDSSDISFSHSGFEENTQYTITIDTTAHDKYGDKLNQQFSSSFTSTTFQIRSTYPSNGDNNVSIYNGIHVSFNDNIDTGSVRNAFSISPTVAGQFVAYYGSFSFNPDSLFLENTQYSVTISSALKSKNGIHLPSAYSFTFTTAGFQVSETYPRNGSNDVTLDRYIRITLSNPIDTSTIRNAFSISPNVAGYFTYISNTSYFQFFPLVSFEENTEYTVGISTSLRSKRGSNLSAPYSFSFTTIPFSIYYVGPSNGSSNVSLNDDIYVSCATPYDTGTVRNAFSITPATEGSFVYISSSRAFRFYPNDGFIALTEYNFSISTALRSKSGNFLQTPYTSSFFTAPFKVLSTYPPDGQINVSRAPDIYVGFNSQIDSGSVRASFSISPFTTGEFILYEKNFHYYPDSLSANTTYSISLSTAMRSKSGSYLLTPYTFSFTTGN
ncbi:MAG: Ig-like domain-containing protein [Ignavibacteriales bacterium]|nr:Ig-like domain-containing protein [Ignavibacteriales bacterium]